MKLETNDINWTQKHNEDLDSVLFYFVKQILHERFWY